MPSIAQKLRLPSVCVLCSQYHSQPVAVCKACTRLFKRIGPACQFCAFPLPDEKFPVCGACVQEKPAFDSTVTRYLFEEPLRSLLHEFKYHEALYLGGFLADLMLEAITHQTIIPQCLIPVPLHPKRIRQRGFNQAAQLTKFLAKKLNIPYDLNLCEKKIYTAPQASLNKTQRKRNLQGAFQSRFTPYRHITLVDDLITTGSTANELARSFKRQGIIRVDLWCCARAV